MDVVLALRTARLRTLEAPRMTLKSPRLRVACVLDIMRVYSEEAPGTVEVSGDPGSETQISHGDNGWHT